VASTLCIHASGDYAARQMNIIESLSAREKQQDLIRLDVHRGESLGLSQHFKSKELLVELRGSDYVFDDESSFEDSGESRTGISSR
jgi:hypothetical protein